MDDPVQATATVRTLGALRQAGLLRKARGVLVRRATDPWEADHSGIMNMVVPEAHIPSHQGSDAQSVLPELDVVTMAATAAHTQCHLHHWTADLTRPATRDDILDALRTAPRVAFFAFPSLIDSIRRDARCVLIPAPGTQLILGGPLAAAHEAAPACCRNDC